MIKTTYTPALEKPPIIGGGGIYDFFPRYNEGIAKRQVLDIDKPYKVTLTILAAVPFLVLAVIFSALLPTVPTIALNVIGVACFAGFVRPLIWTCLKQEVAAVPASRGLHDEVSKIVQTYNSLLRVREFMPEGIGSRERIDDFGRMAFKLFQECERLPKGMDGSNKNFYRVQNEIQQQMQNLINSGRELTDLVASRRAENTLESIKTLGISQYAEHVSLETMAFRALTMGDDDDEPKKVVVGGVRNIPPRPRKKNPGAKSEIPASVFRGIATGTGNAERYRAILDEMETHQPTMRVMGEPLADFHERQEAEFRKRQEFLEQVIQDLDDV